MCFIFIVVEDVEYILKLSVYHNMSSSFKKCLTINVRSLISSICAFYLLTSFNFDCDVINVCL